MIIMINQWVEGCPTVRQTHMVISFENHLNFTMVEDSQFMDGNIVFHLQVIMNQLGCPKLQSWMQSGS
jgi:hypothetical protein